MSSPPGATAVSPDELSHLIHAADPLGPSAGRTIVRTLQGCWPGGVGDRYEPGAVAWLTRWHPDRAGAALPACACATGRCGLCN